MDREREGERAKDSAAHADEGERWGGLEVKGRREGQPPPVPFPIPPSRPREAPTRQRPPATRPAGPAQRPAEAPLAVAHPGPSRFG